MGAMADRNNRLVARARFALALLPLPSLLLVGLAAVLAFGLPDYLSCAALRDNRAWLLTGWPELRCWPCSVFMASMPLAVALSASRCRGPDRRRRLPVRDACRPPRSWSLAATAGRRDPVPRGPHRLPRPAAARASAPGSARCSTDFAAEGFSYLLFLRLVPLFPFFVVNLVPAFLGVSLAQLCDGHVDRHHPRQFRLRQRRRRARQPVRRRRRLQPGQYSDAASHPRLGRPRPAGAGAGRLTEKRRQLARDAQGI